MKCLETERLVLRPFTIDDLDDFYEYAKNPNVGNSGGWKPHQNIEESKAILNSFLEHDEEWAIVYKENNKVIGSISFRKDGKRNVENANVIGYSLSQDYWGRGLMTEAVKQVIKFGFEDMNYVLISIYHFHYNERSRRVIEKCGFVYEGTQRCAYQMYDGKIHNNLCYSILREEYFLNKLK